MTYGMDYAGKEPVQSRSKGAEVANLSQEVRLAPSMRSRRLGVPAIVKTGATFLVAGAVFFGAEALAPIHIRPSTLVGTYDARVQAAVKAAELSQQAKYEAWASEVKVSVDQQVEQYKTYNQASLTNYQAAVDRAKLLADATAKLQSQYVAARIGQAQAAQSGDQAIVNGTRVFGRVLNALQPGAGDGALNYATNLRDELSKELEVAVAEGQTISVEGWDTGLPSADELHSQIEGLKPIMIPPPPKIGEASSSSSR